MKADDDAHWTIYILITLCTLILAKLHYPTNIWFARLLVFSAGANFYIAMKALWRTRK